MYYVVRRIAPFLVKTTFALCCAIPFAVAANVHEETPLFSAANHPDGTVTPRLGQLMNENSRSLPRDNRSRNIDGFWEFVRALREDMNKITISEKRQSAYQMVSKSPWLNAWAAAAPPITDTAQTWRDLDLFAGKPNNPQKYIVNELHRTQTELGFFSQQMLLAFPAQDPAQLRARQEVVRTLITQDALLPAVRSSLQAVADAEIPLFRMNESYDSINNALRWSYLYDTALTTWLNKYAPALFASTTYEQFMSFFNTGQDMMLTGALILYGFYALKNWQSGNAVRGWGLGGIKNTYDDSGKRHKVQKGTDMVDGNARNTSHWLHRCAWRSAKHPVAHALIAWFAAYTYVYSIRRRVRHFIAAQALRTTLHEVMTKIAHVMRSAKQLYRRTRVILSFRQNKELAPLYAFFEKIVPTNTDMRELLSLLETDTFDVAEDFVPAHVGRIIRAQQIFAHHKPLLRSLFLSLGFFDAYASIATLYNEHRNTGVHFCLPRFVWQQEPSITLKGVWHPFVAADAAVPNDITLGSLPAHREAIITGPNTAGKSTLLKSVALAALMAQGWGIAPASALTMTPFSIIETYLNISDDTAEGNSLFKQEVIRANHLLQRIKGLAPGEHALVFFDEMYSGTSPKESVACAYSTAQHLVKQKQALSMVATHFELLTELPEKFAHAGNYRMTVQRPRGGGDFRCSFKIQKGVSHDHVALDVLAQEGVEADILRTAREVLLQQ